MASVINTNMPALNAQRNLSATQTAQAKAIRNLSSGLRVNGAADDAAGLAISERMNAQAKGMSVAIRNANDGVSLAQTADAALGQVGNMLQRMRELAVQSSNHTNTTADRQSLQAEVDQLSVQMSDLLDQTKFNGKDVFTANAGQATFQVGANEKEVMSFAQKDLTTDATITSVIPASSTTNGITTKSDQASLRITTAEDAQAAITKLDAALKTVNSERADWGARQNRFESIVSNLQVGVENTTASRSRIVDADFAQETAALSRTQVLQQAGTAMLAQANQMPQGVLSLLR